MCCVGVVCGRGVAWCCEVDYVAVLLMCVGVVCWCDVLLWRCVGVVWGFEIRRTMPCVCVVVWCGVECPTVVMCVALCCDHEGGGSGYGHGDGGALYRVVVCREAWCHGAIWCGSVRRAMMWCGTSWFGVVWFGAV